MAPILITTVLFDLGGVICRFRPELRLAWMAAACRASAAEIQAFFWESGFDLACDRGEFTALQIYERAQRVLGFSGDFEAFKAAWSLAFEVDTDVLAFAQELADRARVGMLTNNGPVLREALPSELPELSGVFSPALFSCEFGSAKPDAALYEGVSRRIGDAPDRILLIDDSTENVRGAQRAGWRAIHFSGLAALREELANVV